MHVCMRACTYACVRARARACGAVRCGACRNNEMDTRVLPFSLLILGMDICVSVLVGVVVGVLKCVCLTIRIFLENR